MVQRSFCLSVLLVVYGCLGAMRTDAGEGDKDTDPFAGRLPAVGQHVQRFGDEIMVCGQLVHTTAPVVLWIDPGGYDGYRVERRFSAIEKSSWAESKGKDLTMPNRYNLRAASLSQDEIERVRGGGWDLPLLQRVVDQFVIHYDVCGTSRQCFKILHDMRGLSVHFLLDLDGTIYQTLDVKERAWHATIANTRSIGIEIANIGAYPPGKDNLLADWYVSDASGKKRVRIPSWQGDSQWRRSDFTPRPARDEPVLGTIQGTRLRMYDFTPQQYDSLTKLTATLCRTFPKLKCDYPRDAEGKLITRVLTAEQFRRFQGVLGHFHVQANKVDPGPAFQWDRVINGARELTAEGQPGT